MVWRRASRTSGEPTTEGTAGGHRLGGCGKAWPRITDFKAVTIMPFLTQNVAPGSTIYTDGLKSFSGLSEAGFKHVARNQPLRLELRKGAKSAVPLLIGRLATSNSS